MNNHKPPTYTVKYLNHIRLLQDLTIALATIYGYQDNEPLLIFLDSDPITIAHLRRHLYPQHAYYFKAILKYN